MDVFLQVLKAEIQAQQRLLKDSKTFLSTAPPGHLILRKRRTTTSVYQNCKERTAAGWRSKRRSIRKDPQQIYTLIRKKLAENAVRICRHNLPILTQTLDSYQSLYPLTDTLPEHYQFALSLCERNKLDEWKTAPYKKAPFDPKQHIHETLCGELVRSKSEVIIANALFSYGIPFHFEERFPYPNDNGDFYFPDFTIPLPTEGAIIWEHLGLLEVMSYAVHNGQKLHTYQAHDYLIGKNLILTQDDSRGNCSSSFIYQIIERDLLPHFQEALNEKERTNCTGSDI